VEQQRIVEDIRIIKARIIKDLPGMAKKPKAATKKRRGLRVVG
jgi:hypothetical protein